MFALTSIGAIIYEFFHEFPYSRLIITGINYNNPRHGNHNSFFTCFTSVNCEKGLTSPKKFFNAGSALYKQRPESETPSFNDIFLLMQFYISPFMQLKIFGDGCMQKKMHKIKSHELFTMDHYIKCFTYLDIVFVNTSYIF